MPTKITRVSRNVHAVYCEKEIQLLLLSDLHWDNPKCDRVLLKNHMDEAVKRVLDIPGVFGARMTGGGFGGCIVVMCEPNTEIDGWVVRASSGARVVSS